MQPPFDIAADLDTPVSAYRKLAPFRPRFLLESVEGGERLARYSFIGFGDGLEVRLHAGGLTVGGKSRPRPGGAGELLSALRDALARAPKPGAGLSGVPFTGGLVGCAAYDLVRFFEPLPEPAHKPPAGPDALFFAPRSVLVFDHLTRRAALLHDGPESDRAALRKEVIAALRSAVPPSSPGAKHAPPEPSLSPAAFREAVRRAKGHIAAGDVYQLVLSVRFEGACDVVPFEVYRALRLLNPSPYMYFLETGEAAIVGSSPEALVRLQGRQAALRPIAGTRPRGADDEEDARLERELLADEKEAAEHVMLVDLARNDLGRVAVGGSVRVDPYRTIERYSHVMHLVSGVRGVLAPDKDAFDLFAASFPAGTVVGAPKVRAMQLIDEIEPVRRGFYAGTVGYFGAGGGMDQAIAIRTIVLSQGRYRYQAGAGIVADSDPAREHEEVLAKSAALESALVLAEEGL
ncbi:MAG: anthranilate synthase component I family protein [Acidobacteria bacterium]|nr:MAG: anthranilate synthase component I family protein [Acidobacteriota bacterium]